MRAQHQRTVRMLAETMIRRGIRHLDYIHPEGRFAFVVDFDNRARTGHRLPPKAAAEIVSEANKMAGDWRRR